MLDETIITETPPLYSCYGRMGEQVRVPIMGNRAKRILHGVSNVWSGETLLLITWQWDQYTHQYFLRLIRSHWRGWHIVLFEDLGSPHTAEDSFSSSKFACSTGKVITSSLSERESWLPGSCQ